MNRHHPHLTCTFILTTQEWQALYTLMHPYETVPTTPPDIRQVVHWIAQLGGFLGRKGDEQPGPVTLWRGWQRLHDFTTMWRILTPV